MSERSIIQSQMQKKIAEIQLLEEKLKVARIYMKALEDVVRELDRAPTDLVEDSTLRKGSLVAQTRDAILTRGEPLHVDEILAAIGKEISRESKASLAGSLAAYVRKGEIFTRPAPNTFGLVELGHTDSTEQATEPPEGFGFVSNEHDEIPF